MCHHLFLSKRRTRAGISCRFLQKNSDLSNMYKKSPPRRTSAVRPGAVLLMFSGYCAGAGALSERRGLLFQLGDEGGELFGAFLLGLDHVLRGLGQEAGVLELVVELI